ncbi:hypothetical protein CSUI_006093, partial [Cystoisospora suis]
VSFQMLSLPLGITLSLPFFSSSLIPPLVSLRK